MNKESLRKSLKAVGEMWLERAEEVTDTDLIIENSVIMRNGTGYDESKKIYFNLTLYFHTYNEEDLVNFRKMIAAFVRNRKGI